MLAQQLVSQAYLAVLCQTVLGLGWPHRFLDDMVIGRERPARPATCLLPQDRGGLLTQAAKLVCLVGVEGARALAVRVHPVD